MATNIGKVTVAIVPSINWQEILANFTDTALRDVIQKANEIIEDRSSGSAE